MTHSDICPEPEGITANSQAPITIDPLSFFQYASASINRWHELIGLTITHCTFGLGTIKKIEGEYLYVDLPQYQGKKNLIEFGLDAFQRGFFNNLQIDHALQEKILAAAAALQEMPPQSETPGAVAPKAPAKKKRKSAKATKKAKVEE